MVVGTENADKEILSQNGKTSSPELLDNLDFKPHFCQLAEFLGDIVDKSV